MKTFGLPAIIALLVIFGCHPAGYTLPKFSYNHKKHNSLIVNRWPDYGDGHRDGCLGMNEMYVQMNRMTKDSLLFEVKDVTSGKPVVASIQIFYKNAKQEDSFQTNSAGLLAVKKTPGIEKLKVNSMGYRLLEIDLSQLSGL